MSNPRGNPDFQKFLARRVLARRRLLQFTKLTHAAYTPGWVHDDICRRLEVFSNKVAEKKSPRLMLLLPPRSGKSELASIRFPAWHLGHHPTHEIINVGYNLDLPMEFSRKVREIMRDGHYQKIFPDTALDPNSQSVESWRTTKGGGYLAAGVGGGITGKGCFHASTFICTPHGRRAITTLLPGDLVYGYDHDARRIVTTRVVAVSAASHVRGTKDFGTTRCTDDHKFFSPGTGYVPAREVERFNLPVLRRTETLQVEAVRGVLHRYTSPGITQAVRMRTAEVPSCIGVLDVLPREFARSGSGFAVRTLRGWFSSREICAGQARAAAVVSPYVLLVRMLRSLAHRAGVAGQRYMRLVPRPIGWGGEKEILLKRLLQPHAGGAVGSRAVHPQLAAGEAPYPGAGPARLRDDAAAQAARGAPHRPQPGKQRARESCMLIEGGARVLSFDVSRSASDIAHLVHQPGFETVYDIQTGTGNFFANRLLAHNCHILIIDDPLKNQEEADSVLARDRLWNWYQSTAYTRLAPGGGVLAIETWWSDDDLAGRLQQAMATSPDADQYEVVKYPALSEAWEYRDEATMEIIRTEEEIVPPREGYTLLRPKDFCLHEERYPTEALKRMRANMAPRIWSALYQQNPVPDEGMYFKKEFFRYRKTLPSPEGLRIYTAWDFAISVKQQNDWTVGATIMQDAADTLFVAEIFRMKGDSFQIVEAILDVAARWGTIPGSGYLFGVEDGQIWRAIEPLLKRRMQERGQFPPYEVLRPLTDKMARARPLQGRMQQGRVVFPEEAPWLQQAEHELLRFPAGAHDDVVDALAWVAHLCLGKTPPRVEQPKPMPSWRDKLLIGDSGGSHMVA